MGRVKIFVVTNNIRHYRELHNMTQTQLAKYVGVSKNTISSIETGQFVPTLELAARLCFGLGVGFSDLFSFEYHRNDGDIVIYKF